MSNLTPLLLVASIILTLLCLMAFYLEERTFKKLIGEREKVLELEAKNRIAVQHIELIGKSLGHATARQNEINIHLFGDVRNRTMEEIIKKIGDMKVAEQFLLNQVISEEVKNKTMGKVMNDLVAERAAAYDEQVDACARTAASMMSNNPEDQRKI